MSAAGPARAALDRLLDETHAFSNKTESRDTVFAARYKELLKVGGEPASVSVVDHVAQVRGDFVRHGDSARRAGTAIFESVVLQRADPRFRKWSMIGCASEGPWRAAVGILVRHHLGSLSDNAPVVDNEEGVDEVEEEEEEEDEDEEDEEDEDEEDDESDGSSASGTTTTSGSDSDLPVASGPRNAAQANDLPDPPVVDVPAGKDPFAAASAALSNEAWAIAVLRQLQIELYCWAFFCGEARAELYRQQRSIYYTKTQASHANVEQTRPGTDQTNGYDLTDGFLEP